MQEEREAGEGNRAVPWGGHPVERGHGVGRVAWQRRGRSEDLGGFQRGWLCGSGDWDSFEERHRGHTRCRRVTGPLRVAQRAAGCWQPGLAPGYQWHTDFMESADCFGAALTAGDFNGDGVDDLAIGVPGEDIGGIEDAGVVQIIFGSASGLTSDGDQFWYQNTPVILESAEQYDQFSSSLSH